MAASDGRTGRRRAVSVIGVFAQGRSFANGVNLPSAKSGCLRLELIADRQRADALAGRREDRVGDRRQNWRDSRLADSAEGLAVVAADDVYANLAWRLRLLKFSVRSISIPVTHYPDI